MEAMTTAANGLSFGPFHLVASERVLMREGAPLKLGSRALDILIVLISAPNEVVGKKDLMSRVWPDVSVEEGSLRFHMANLRKALGDGKDGARYIATLPGRGYCFVAPISRPSRAREDAPVVLPVFAHANLPGRLSRMVGRNEDVLELSAQLNASRFVTIVGAGGVGKTTVAVALGHYLAEGFAGAVLFVDLGVLRDPALVATAVASLLGLSVQSNDATPGLVAYLRDKRILLILDTCEHLVEAVADLASSIIDAAPQVHILATSREALRVESEYIYRLDALACPPDDPGLTAAVVRTFPATQLFVERAAASGARLDISDAEAVIVASICRRLDGVALAIELAARRVESYGLQQTAALLNQRLTLLWIGSRTAPARQKTLHATLDWSFGLLTELERAVLRRLSAFVGHFTLDAAMEVVTSTTLDRSTVLGAMDSLVAKSIVATRPVGAMMRYRLLDTTRAYVLEINIDDTESADLAARHAAYYRGWLQKSGTAWSDLATGEERIPHFAAVDNVRAALEWCFGANGNVDIGVGLAVAAAPVFLAMSLLPECHRWSERAIFALDDAARGGLDEMHLQAALGVSLMFMQGGRDPARAALEKSFAIAEERGDALDQLRLLGPLNMFYLRAGNFAAALKYARRGFAAIETVEDAVAVSVAHHLLGISLHLSGDLAGARAELEAALDHGPASQRSSAAYLGFESPILANAIFARNLWLQGHPDEAIAWARKAVEEARAGDHSLTLAIVSIWAISVFLWAGELASATAHIDLLIARAESHSLAPYLLVARGFKSEVAIRQGDAKGGVEKVQQGCLQKLHTTPYELLTTELNLSLAWGLSVIGRVDEAISLIDESLAQVETNGNLLYRPELLRVKGAIFLLPPNPSPSNAEACLLQALELSRRQGARGWELRTAIDLAKLLAGRNDVDRAHQLLRPVFERFEEGLGTADLKAAERLLATLG